MSEHSRCQTVESIVRIQTVETQGRVHADRREPGLSNGRRPVPVQMPLRLVHHQSRQSHASQHHTRARTNNTRQTKPLRQQDCTTGLKTIVHSVPRCSHFYRHFPALCLLLRSNPLTPFSDIQLQLNVTTLQPQDGP
jgi:hypothetical protein